MYLATNNMADSIKVVDEDAVKRLHAKHPSGHLHKGHGVVAANSSIPSKYQTIVTDNSDRKGFSSKAKRFQFNAFLSENPSPCNYVGHSQYDKDGVSFSKKGTGSFASKSKRSLRYNDVSSAPGPGIYGLPDMLSNRHDFNRSGSTSTFQKPIAQKSNRVKGNPAPNSYDIFKSKVGKCNNVSADAAFKSRSKREIINVAESKQFPAPWQYNVKDEILHSNPRIPESSFKSRTLRRIGSNPTDVPGPGTYFSPEDNNMPLKVIFP
ncbi:O(6)-methylguanine-induced apoptosis 2 [Patella vulgata]|uniref:O(6)-methylguanine-induced apoptosis 2 n=1 Tax=Patella vulgata TaxID=6465 RepID=UPI00217F5244|nr:O(6)-methylguanine-induced apoptosis 2 [Patella vulgata]